MESGIPSVRRDLEFIPVRHEGQPVVVVRDPLGLVPEGRALPGPLYEFVTLLNGRNGLRDLQAELMRRSSGSLVGLDDVRRILQELDRTFLLDSEGFQQARAEIVSAFCTASVRPCSHAGGAYPDDPASLRGFLDDVLARGGEGSPSTGGVQALVSPHIDLSVGGRGYGRAYKALEGTAPSRVVVLGVGHQMAGHLFSVSSKDFDTPLGRVAADRETAERLKRAGGDGVAPDDFAHRSEHSIEFQTLFLSHVLGPDAFLLIPILCGSAQASLPAYSRQAFLDRAGPFLEALERTCAWDQGETLLVAGVDLSHTGPKFGQPAAARSMEGAFTAHDRALLDGLLSGDAEGFWEESARVEDRYNVCGFTALATLLEVHPPSAGRLLHYEVWHEAPTQSAVSFAAAVFSPSRRARPRRRSSPWDE